MSSTSWLDLTALKLHRAGLPAEYVQRTIIELADHAIELDEHSDSAGSSLLIDSSGDLTKQLIRSYRRSKWYRRVPSLAWLLIPFPLLVLVCIGFHLVMLLLAGVTYADLLEPRPTPGIETFLIPWVLYTGKFATPLIACYVLFKFLNKAARPAWVNCCSIAILAFWFLATSTEMSLPTSSSKGSFNVSVESDAFGDPEMIGWQVFQAMLVISLALAEKFRRKAPAMAPQTRLQPLR